MSAQAVSPSAPSLIESGKAALIRTTLIVTRVIGFVVVALATYLLAMFAAGQLMPNLMTMVASGMGMDIETATLAGFGVWLMSSAVLVLLVTALVIVVVRALWKYYLTLMARLSTRLAPKA